MHILFLSHYFPPEVNAPASRTYDNCKRWVAMGHKVTVVTCAPNCPDGVVYEGYQNKPFQREFIDGIEVIRIWTYVAANSGTTKRILNYLSYMASATTVASLLPKPDVLIATSPQFFCGWAGVLTSAFRRVPFLLEIRDIWPESILAVGAMRKSLAIQGIELLEHQMYNASWHIVTVGRGYRQQLLERNVPPEKISIVMNGIDRKLFYPRPPNEEFKAQLGLQGKFVSSYVGTIGMACALDVALRAGKLLKEQGHDDIALLIVGDGAVREELQAAAAQQGLDNVVFTGRLDKKRMPDVLSITDACLVHLRKTPLFETAMPSKIFEAGGMAKPILLGVKGDAADLVTRANAGICFEPEDEHALVEGLLRLKQNPTLREEYGQNGFQYICEHFDRDKLALDYIHILDKLIASQP